MPSLPILRCSILDPFGLSYFNGIFDLMISQFQQDHVPDRSITHLDQTEAMPFVTSIDETFHRPSHVFGQFLEQRFGFFLCERPHDVLCFVSDTATSVQFS